MEFARKQLEKYGWKEGKGLGRNEDGISEALRGKKKSTRSGLGHSLSKEHTDKWWDKVYNDALNNIQLEVDEDGSLNKISTLTNKGIERGQEMPSKYAKKFIRKVVMQSGSTRTLTNKEDEQACDLSDTGETASEGDSPKSKKLKPKILTDDELFAACEGRTAHKGARHGLTASGKLDRIRKQEEEFCRRLRSNDTTKTQNETSKREKDSDDVSPRAKKLKGEMSKNSEDHSKKEDSGRTDISGIDVSKLVKKSKSTKKKSKFHKTSVNTKSSAHNVANVSEEDFNCSRESRRRTSINYDTKGSEVLEESNEKVKLNETLDIIETADFEKTNSLKNKVSENNTDQGSSVVVSESKDEITERDKFVNTDFISDPTEMRKKKISQSIEAKDDVLKESDIIEIISVRSEQKHDNIEKSDKLILDNGSIAKNNSSDSQKALKVVNIDSLLAKPSENRDILELSDDSSNENVETLLIKPDKKNNKNQQNKFMLNPIAAQYKNLLIGTKSVNPISKNINFMNKTSQPSHISKPIANEEVLILDVLQKLREKLAIQRLAQEKANLRMKRRMEGIKPSGIILEVSDDDDDNLHASKIPTSQASKTQTEICNLSDSTETSSSEDDSDESLTSDDRGNVKKNATAFKILCAKASAKNKSVVISDSSDEDEVIFSGYEFNESQNYIPQKPNIPKRRRSPLEEFDPMQFVECEVIIETKNNENIDLHDSDVCEVTDDEIITNNRKSHSTESQIQLTKKHSINNPNKVEKLLKKIDITAVLKKSDSFKKVDKTLKKSQKPSFRMNAIDLGDESTGTDTEEEINLKNKQSDSNHLNKTKNSITSKINKELCASSNNDENIQKNKGKPLDNDCQNKKKERKKSKSTSKQLNAISHNRVSLDKTLEDDSSRKGNDSDEVSQTRRGKDIETRRKKNELKDTHLLTENYPKCERRKKNSKKLLTGDETSNNSRITMACEVEQKRGRNKSVSPKKTDDIETVGEESKVDTTEDSKTNDEDKNKSIKKENKYIEVSNENEAIDEPKVKTSKELSNDEKSEQKNENRKQRKGFRKREKSKINLERAIENIEEKRKARNENKKVSFVFEQNQLNIRQTREKILKKRGENSTMIKDGMKQDNPKKKSKSPHNEIETQNKSLRKVKRSKHYIEDLNKNIEGNDQTLPTRVKFIERTLRKNDDDDKLSIDNKLSDPENIGELPGNGNKNKSFRKVKRSKTFTENIGSKVNEKENMEIESDVHCENEDAADHILPTVAKSKERTSKKNKGRVESLVNDKHGQNDDCNKEILDSVKRQTKSNRKKNDLVEDSATESSVKDIDSSVVLRTKRVQNPADEDHGTEISPKGKRSNRNNQKKKIRVSAEDVASIDAEENSPKNEKDRNMKRKLHKVLSVSLKKMKSDVTAENERKSALLVDSPKHRMGKRQKLTADDSTTDAQKTGRNKTKKEVIARVMSADNAPMKKSKRRHDKLTEKVQNDLSKFICRKSPRK